MRVIHEEINLIPTEVKLCVVIGKKKEVRKSLREKFGKRKSYWRDMITSDPCVFEQGNNRIVMSIITENGEVDLQDIVHEAVHVTWFLSDMVGLNLDSNSQETQAYYTDYIFGKVLDLSKK